MSNVFGKRHPEGLISRAVSLSVSHSLTKYFHDVDNNASNLQYKHKILLDFVLPHAELVGLKIKTVSGYSCTVANDSSCSVEGIVSTLITLENRTTLVDIFVSFLYFGYWLLEADDHNT